MLKPQNWNNSRDGNDNKNIDYLVSSLSSSRRISGV